jgi:hypothetical protein
VSWQSGKMKKHAAGGAQGAAARVVIRPLAVTAVVILAAAFLANSMTKEVSRDEQMYCTAGVLLAQGKVIYRDFSYASQLPYHPLLLAAVYRGLGTTRYLLAGRLVSVVCDVAVLLLIILLYRSLFAPRRRAGLLFGLAAATVYAFNPLVDYAAGYAWNHDVVILCAALSLWLLLTTDFQRRPRFWRVGAIGALLTFATCMRVTTVLVELLFLAGVLYLAGGSLGNRGKTALPFLAAALAVLIWPLWVIAQAPHAFWLNLVRIPALYGVWLHEIGMTYSKPSLTAASVLTAGYLAVLVPAVYLAWAAWKRTSSLDAPEKQKAVFAALLPLVFFVIAYIPPTMWQQYLAVPVPFLVMGLAYPLLGLCRGAEKPQGRCRYQLAGCLLGVAATVCILAYPVVLYRSIFVLVPERWTPVELHQTALRIAAQGKSPGRVLTLGPLYALEGRSAIYPELACGDIIYRVADRMSAEDRRLTRTVGPATLDEMVKTDPPAAVIVGVEPPPFSSLETPLRRIAPSDWPRDTYGRTLQVHVRP